MNAPSDGCVGWWRFDKTDDKTTTDAVTGTADRVEGRFKYVDGVAGTALKYDGFTTAVVREAVASARLEGAFSAEAWVALGAYPWNFCPVISQRDGEGAGFDFAIGARGQVRLAVASAGEWVECVSKDFVVGLRTWTHVACTCGADGALAVYVNGRLAGESRAKSAPAFAPGCDVYIGALKEPVRPAHHRGEGGTRPSWFCLDGMLDELKLYNRALSADEVAAAHGAITPAPQRELMPRRMPSGPAGPGRFGATYCKLKYYDEWDAVWPVGDHPDVLVRFDASPVRVVFWRGTRFSPVWVSENDLWMADQSVEAWGDDQGCYEHMQDRHCHYSHVRVLESTDARVVVHWRYAPTSSRDNHWKIDPKTLWGCWVDEYYYIYPDAMGIRKVTWKAGTLGPTRQFQESLPLSHPGQVQGDIVEREYATVANLDNQTNTLCYRETPGKTPAEEMPSNPLIQRYNFRSTWRPFIIFEDGNEMGAFFNKPLENMQKPGTCNHWPVCQARSDGRDSQATDRPAHFLGFPISYPKIHRTGDVNWYNSLYGMTDQPMEHLVEVAKSWNHPPALTVNAGAVVSDGYHRDERAYVLHRGEGGGGGATEIRLTLAAGKSTPAYNPVFVLRGWGEDAVEVVIDGQPAARGERFRAGYSRDIERTDLVIWTRQHSTRPIDMVLRPAPRQV